MMLLCAGGRSLQAERRRGYEKNVAGAQMGKNIFGADVSAIK